MNTREHALARLAAHKGHFVSGATLAEELNVSRTAIWKAIKTLQDEGYSIEAITNKGYALSPTTDFLSAQSIKDHLRSTADLFDITILPSTDSTNNVARTKALAGAPEGTVVIAEEQTHGRGRRGRSFFSPSHSGIYVSVVLRPSILVEQASFITAAAAVAVAEAIETTTDQKASIKWVNDIFCGTKKVCGILTEATFDIENGGFEYAVVGIGINVKTPGGGFPSSLENSACALLDADANDIRSILAAETLERFWHYYTNFPAISFYEDYRRRSFLIGKKVDVVQGSEKRRVTVLDITDDFKLSARCEDGSLVTISSGEAVFFAEKSVQSR